MIATIIGITLGVIALIIEGEIMNRRHRKTIDALDAAVSRRVALNPSRQFLEVR